MWLLAQELGPMAYGSKMRFERVFASIDDGNVDGELDCDEFVAWLTPAECVSKPILFGNKMAWLECSIHEMACWSECSTLCDPPQELMMETVTLGPLSPGELYECRVAAESSLGLVMLFITYSWDW